MKKQLLYIYFIINILIISLVEIVKLDLFTYFFLTIFINFLFLYFVQKNTILAITSFYSHLFKKKDIEFLKSNLFLLGNKEIKDLSNLLTGKEIIYDNLQPTSEQSIAKSLEAILNSTLDGIIVINNERDIVMANDSFYRLCGYEAREISGKNTTGMVAPENILSRNLIRFIKYSFDNYSVITKNIPTGIIEIRNLNQYKVLKATATPLRYNFDTLDGLVINLRDISKELEAETEKKTFISNISHEFRTPLCSILGFSNILFSDSELDLATVKNFAETIYNESLKLSDIIDNLLNILHMDMKDFKINIEEIKIKDLLNSTIEEFEQRKPYNIKIVNNVEFDSVTILNDQENITTIIKNLLSNALKFSLEGKEVIISSLKNEDHIIIRFTNYGKQIPPDIKEKIFDKFFRVENHIHQLPGIGLGLFITRTLVRLHGGDITYHSLEDGETTFYLSLPLISTFDKDSFNLI